MPDHIVKINFPRPYGRGIKFGMLKKNLTLNAKQESVSMLFKGCIEFADLLEHVNKKDLYDNLVKEAKEQLNR